VTEYSQRSLPVCPLKAKTCTFAASSCTQAIATDPSDDKEKRGNGTAPLIFEQDDERSALHVPFDLPVRSGLTAELKPTIEQLPIIPPGFSFQNANESITAADLSTAPVDAIYNV
jgi:hypothetical protein